MTDIGLYSLDDAGVVTFSFANMSRLVTGPEEALQVVANAIFTEPGSVAFARQDGGGALKLIRGHALGRAELRTEAAICVRRAMDTIRRNQSQDKAANATIVDLKLVDVRVENQTDLFLDIRIDLRDGNSFRASFKVT